MECGEYHSPSRNPFLTRRLLTAGSVRVVHYQQRTGFEQNDNVLSGKSQQRDHASYTALRHLTS